MKIDKYSISGFNHPNQDRLKYQNLGIFGVAISVSDGMGGKSCGDIAAKSVCKDIVDFISTNYKGYSEKTCLSEALNKADNNLSEKIDLYKLPMGTATIAAIITDYSMFFSWQGNVRLYLLHRDKLQCLTQDHVLDTGYDEKRLTRCIKGCGIRESLPFTEFKLCRHDIVYICTDGFYSQYENLLIQDDFNFVRESISQVQDDATIIKITI